MDPRELAEPVIRDLLAADTVLPEQFWASKYGSTNLSGEHALMWAVLADGIECYRRNVHARSGHQRLEFLDAEAWISRTDWDWPFSFVNLCEMFGFDPAGVRHALWQLRDAGKAQVFRRQRFRPVTLNAA
jgi:hypothetical protein